MAGDLSGVVSPAHDDRIRIVVANSNRVAGPRASGTLDVLDTAAALAGRPALLGLIPAGSPSNPEAGCSG